MERVIQYINEETRKARQAGKTVGIICTEESRGRYPEGILEEIENPLQLLRLSGFQEEWKPEQRALKERLEQVYLDAGYQVPPVEEVVGKERNQEVARQLLDRLVQEGRLRRLSQSFYIHETNWKQAMALLKSHAKSHGSITLAQYRDLLSASRKYAALILEYLDEQKATRLEGEIRILLREV